MENLDLLNFPRDIKIPIVLVSNTSYSFNEKHKKKA